MKGLLINYRSDMKRDKTISISDVVLKSIDTFKNKYRCKPNMLVVRPEDYDKVKGVTIQVTKSSMNNPCQPGHIILYGVIDRKPILSMERSPCM